MTTDDKKDTFWGDKTRFNLQSKVKTKHGIGIIVEVEQFDPADSTKFRWGVQITHPYEKHAGTVALFKNSVLYYMDREVQPA